MLKIIQSGEPDYTLPKSYATDIDQLSEYLRYANKLKGVNAEELKSAYSAYQAYEIGYKAGMKFQKSGGEYDKRYSPTIIKVIDTETNNTYDLNTIKDFTDLMQAIKFGKSFEGVDLAYISEAIKGYAAGYEANRNAENNFVREEKHSTSAISKRKEKTFGFGVLIGLLIAVAVFATICTIAYAVGYFYAAGAINGAVDSLKVVVSEIATIAFA